MGSYTVDFCDECGKEIWDNNKFLIYRIDFWNKKEYNAKSKDYLFDKDIALILCSKKCIGEHISKLIKGEIEE